MKLRLKLATMAEVNAVRRATPKGLIPSRKLLKGRKTRAEKVVKVDVRAKCEARDGDCRVGLARKGDQYEFENDVFGGPCNGLPEWAHLGEKTRAKTRGQAPEVRHTTQGSCILCKHHHDRYDGRARPRFTITALSKRGADGPLRFEGVR